MEMFPIRLNLKSFCQSAGGFYCILTYYISAINRCWCLSFWKILPHLNNTNENRHVHDYDNLCWFLSLVSLCLGVRGYVLTNKMFYIVKMLEEAESIYLRLKRSSYFVPWKANPSNANSLSHQSWTIIISGFKREH